MNKDVKAVVEMIANNPGNFEIGAVSQRPWSAVTIRKRGTTIYGRGFACCQLPDLWSEGMGLKTAYIRAIKNLLGMPSRVEQSAFLATQVEA